MEIFPMPSHHTPAVLLASADAHLITELGRMLPPLGLTLRPATDGRQAHTAMDALEAASERPGILLLDARLSGAEGGRLLASVHERGARRRWAIALIADEVSDEWIARLREGAIDDIIPRSSTTAAWKTHLNTMQRGHALYCELEQLRENSLLEVKHDAVTGTLNRDTMLTILFRETDRVQRQQGAMSVMAMGLADFSHWSEQLGHEGADQLLREVARRAGRMLRTYDAAGRIGYDEFLFILPGCGTVNTVMLAERLREEVFGEPFWVKCARRGAEGRQEIVELRLSACFGVALSRGRSPVVVVREAEQTLALARRHGAGTIRSAADVSGPSDRELAAQLFPEVGTLAG